MTSNSVYNKMVEFAKPTFVSVDKFLELLQTSTRSSKMRITWQTEGSANGTGKPPHKSTHLMWWDSNLFVGGDAGGSAVKAMQDQLNLQVTPGVDNWRTLSYNNIESFTFKGKLYKIQ
jgi:hypothetical protein